MINPPNDELAAVRRLKEENDKLVKENHSLKQGGGGGTSGGMDARVTRLEARVDKVIDDISGVRVGLATLTERVAHLPSKGFIVSSLTTGVAVLGGIVLMADRLKTLLGL